MQLNPLEIRKLKIRTIDDKVYEIEAHVDISIKDLKIMIESLTSIEASKQRLICKGKLMKDETKLKDYDLRDNEFLHMISGNLINDNTNRTELNHEEPINNDSSRSFTQFIESVVNPLSQFNQNSLSGIGHRMSNTRSQFHPNYQVIMGPIPIIPPLIFPRNRVIPRTIPILQPIIPIENEIVNNSSNLNAIPNFSQIEPRIFSSIYQLENSLMSDNAQVNSNMNNRVRNVLIPIRETEIKVEEQKMNPPKISQDLPQTSQIRNQASNLLNVSSQVFPLAKEDKKDVKQESIDMKDIESNIQRDTSERQNNQIRTLSIDESYLQQINQIVNILSDNLEYPNVIISSNDPNKSAIENLGIYLKKYHSLLLCLVSDLKKLSFLLEG